MNWKEALKKAAAGRNPVEFVNEVREFLHREISPNRIMPVDFVRWVPLQKVQANDYNPNAVATREMQLLYISISSDGYTQPVVTFYNPEQDKYIIVDGFHRYTVMRNSKELQKRTGGYLPVVVIDKPLGERIAATVRHNRARGRHSVYGMANLVFKMLDEGYTDEEVATRLGLSPEELVRLKHITGFSKLLQNVEYHRAWETRRQVLLKKEWEEKHGEKAVI